ncbi:LPXTG cell wall anchor domain-containing protein [Streptomyces sp. NBC_00461]|uniref:LPXTG cell wall anchor domain-containing protein n=1 Tax=Streptomyces sp. NBC_00461 TaxID=2975750 RepID=UPI002E18CC56
MSPPARASCSCCGGRLPRGTTAPRARRACVPAGIPLHDPDASNDSVTFAFGASATPTATASSDGTLAATGESRTALIATAAGCAALLGGAVLVVRRRRRSH